ISYATLRRRFDVPLLHGRKIPIKDDQWNLVCRCFGANFVEFAAADQRRRISDIANLKDSTGNSRAGAASQLYKFGERFPALFGGIESGDSGSALPAHTYKQGAFSGGKLVSGTHEASISNYTRDRMCWLVTNT